MVPSETRIAKSFPVALLNKILNVNKSMKASVLEVRPMRKQHFILKQRTENIYEKWKSENNKKLSDKPSKEDGETLERFYNRINLDKRRRKSLDDSKEKNTPPHRAQFSLSNMNSRTRK